MTVAPSFLIREPAEVYQEKASEYLTSHQLADFRRCPLLYHKKKLGLVEEEDRPAFLVGRALHTLVLEGREAFEQEYAVGGPVNPRTGQPYGSNTKAFAQWAAEQGKPVLTLSQVELVNNMARAVRSHQLATELLSSGMPERVVRTEYCGLPCQVRIDWFDPYRGIVDLKTCDDLDCADCGQPMYRRRSCRWCYGIRAVVVPDNPVRESSLLDHLLATDDYSDESDADGARRESSLADGQVL